MTTEGNQNSILCRKFVLIIESAEDLPDVRELFRTKAYAEVFLVSSGDQTSSKTEPDHQNGLNPVWNHSMAFQVTAASVKNYDLSVIIKLYADRSFGDRFIGEVRTTVKNLYELAEPVKEGIVGGSQSLPLTTGGTLKFLYGFGEEFQVEKYSRWKGFVQGIAIAAPIITLADVTWKAGELIVKLLGS